MTILVVRILYLLEFRRFQFGTRLSGWRDRHRDGPPPDRDRDSRYGSGRGSYSGGGGGGSSDSWLSGLPRGTPLSPGVNCMDAISQTVASIRPGQMMEILSSMKVILNVATTLLVWV